MNPECSGRTSPEFVGSCVGDAWIMLVQDGLAIYLCERHLAQMLARAK